jgi:hypothetical protein
LPDRTVVESSGNTTTFTTYATSLSFTLLVGAASAAAAFGGFAFRQPGQAGTNAILLRAVDTWPGRGSLVALASILGGLPLALRHESRLRLAQLGFAHGLEVAPPAQRPAWPDRGAFGPTQGTSATFPWTVRDSARVIALLAFPSGMRAATCGVIAAAASSENLCEVGGQAFAESPGTSALAASEVVEERSAAIRQRAPTPEPGVQAEERQDGDATDRR